MRVYANQLKNHLKQTLEDQYVIFGGEPLQTRAALTTLRAEAKKNGYTQYEAYEITGGFDWSHLQHSLDNQSLFAERQMVVLRINDNKLSAKDSKQLLALRAGSDQLLVIIALHPQHNQQQWLKKLEQKSTAIIAKPFNQTQTQTWLQEQCEQRNLHLNADAKQMLLDCTEGNLLATEQILQRLQLTDQKQFDSNSLSNYLDDNTRFSLFDCVDAALMGEINRTKRILMGLKIEGVAPSLVLWALTREMRTLLLLHNTLQTGMSLNNALRQHQVWAQRGTVVSTALKKLSLTKLQNLISYAAKADKVIKGYTQGNIWDMLLELCLGLSGHRLHSMEEAPI